MTTTSTEAKPAVREPAYRLNRDEEGLTERERQVRELLHATPKLTQQEIADRIGVNKQRVSEIKLKLESEGKLDLPKPLELFTKSEWRAVSGALRKYGDSATQQPIKDAAARALEKTLQLRPKGVSW